MRLICPNCGAQYEVPDQVIPEGGRDVQCSNCGHTWFQAHPDDDPDLAAELDATQPQSGWETGDPGDAGRDRMPDPEPEPDPEPDPPAEPDPAPEAPPAPQPRGLDPAVAEVLREEADRETRRRAAEAESLESQPDLGLSEPDEDEAARRQRQARERMARMRGETPAERAAASTGAVVTPANSRRDLLPNVDEINQTLRASSDRREVETPQGRAPVEDDAGGGFGRGFAWMVLLVAVAVGVYVFAPQIAEWVPAVSGPLDAYVAWVDGLRLWLADLAGGSEDATAPDDATQ